MKPFSKTSARFLNTQLRLDEQLAAESFHTLAAQTVWMEDTLKHLFWRGFSSELQSELACRDEGRSLVELIDPTIPIDNLIHSQCSTRACLVSPLKPTVEPNLRSWCHTSESTVSLLWSGGTAEDFLPSPSIIQYPTGECKLALQPPDQGDSGEVDSSVPYEYAKQHKLKLSHKL